jgi:hypothetical protein
VTLADATTALLQQGQVVWRRSEALSCVLASRFVVRVFRCTLGLRVVRLGVRIQPRRGAQLRAGLPLRGALVVMGSSCPPPCSAAVNHKDADLPRVLTETA